MSDDEFYLSPVEQAILKAMRDGLFDDLPGFGKPLKLMDEVDPNTPDDMRMAYKIMKDHQVIPEWMMMGDALTEQDHKIRQELQRGLRAYQGALNDADRAGDLGKRSRANQTWERLLSVFQEAVDSYNRNVLTYNLKIPPGVPKRVYFDIQREITRLKAQV